MKWSERAKICFVAVIEVATVLLMLVTVIVRNQKALKTNES